MLVIIKDVIGRLHFLGVGAVLSIAEVEGREGSFIVGYEAPGVDEVLSIPLPSEGIAYKVIAWIAEQIRFDTGADVIDLHKCPEIIQHDMPPATVVYNFGIFGGPGGKE